MLDACLLEGAGAPDRPDSHRFAGDNQTAPLPPLAGHGRRPHAVGMFVVSEADAAAIRTVFEQEGEFSAAIELRRRFPGIADNEQARTIAGWTPLPETPRSATRLRPLRNR
jgi:hypothetical protein